MSFLFEGVARLRASDWLLLLIPLLISLAGVLTMHTFGGENSLAPRQTLWILIATALFILFASLDLRFLRRTPVIITTYIAVLMLLVLLLVVAEPIQGAKSWFSLGTFSFQPADAAKLVLIALLAKYFSRRHIEIRNIRHILISGAYAFAPAVLVLAEPDLGTAVILGAVWLGMILMSGISKRHLAAVALLGIVAAALLWFGGLEEYQRVRITAFLNPAADIQGAGYNAYQAVVAIGSGEVLGKGIGYGTQSKLRFLPEYETDFIFAAFAEEWGFVGIIFLLLLYGILVFRLVHIARRSPTNFDALFTLGVAILFLSHISIHGGINLGLLPVTGTTIPFMSYGGSHLAMEYAALGVVVSLARYGRAVSRETGESEYVGG